MSARSIVELRGVSKIYGTPANPLPVLRDVNLTVTEGEYVAIIGPSGSGKSTLLNILGCLDTPTKGHYFLAGEDVANFDDRKLSLARNTRLGFVFQSFHLISHLTVLENAALPLFYARASRSERQRRCRELLDKVGLGHRLGHRPAELSGGERQRCAVARALANDPAVLLADEPTGNLDSKTGAEIMQLFHELNAGGATLILITHDPAIAEAAPRRVSLLDGRIESDVLVPASEVAAPEVAKP